MTVVRPSRIRPALPLVTVLVALAGLLVSGLFLYRWVNRLSELDLRRQQEDLDASVINLQREFAATFREAMWFFRPTPGFRTSELENAYSELYSQWKTAARWPQVICAVSIGTKAADGSAALAQLDPKTEKFKQIPWPASLGKFRDALNRGPAAVPRLHSSQVRGFGRVVLSGAPMLVLPLLSSRPGPALAHLQESGRLRAGRPEERGAPVLPGPGPQDEFAPLRSARRAAVNAGPAGPQFAGWCFLTLNQKYIETQLLPFLVKQYFGGAGLGKYRVAVVAENPRRVIYASSPGTTLENILPSDAAIALFGPQRVIYTSSRGINLFPSDASSRLFRPRTRVDFPPAPSAPPAGSPRRRTRAAAQNGTRSGLRGEERGQFRGAADDSSGAWQLLARDRMGSLAAEIAAARRRDLVIGFGMLLLLAGSIAAMVVATYRARTLAKRQMEFVAGISHELRTPLTVIDSAAFNLATGRVNDVKRVRQYGEAIQTESHRLSGLFGQTLAYAGIQAGRQPYDFKPVHILEVVDAALAEYNSDFSGKGWRVEKVLETNLPLVSADYQILKSTVKNLVENALKYAAEGKWLRVTARTVEGWRASEIEVAIADHGPGIEPQDLPHIFEPFYRGHRVVASPVPGTGLGLSLVYRYIQAHGGRVTVHSLNGSGTEFALRLPCL
jgi:two-component system, OmpR family, sensor histidine kinase SenX3